MANETTTGATGPAGRGDRTAPGLILLRTHEVYSYLVIGKSAGEIMRIVAERVRDERKEKREWEARRKDHEEREQPFTEEPPDIVWGTVPSDRTITRYIGRAKIRLQEEGRTLSKHAEKVLGIQWARLNAVFHAAFEAGKYNVCARLIEIGNDMFSFKGAMALPLQTPQGDDSTKQPVPETPMTEAGALKEMRDLLNSGRNRLSKHGAQN